MRVALLGGSFNPPHVGHLLAAHYVRATQPVDEVWLMPAYRHPFAKSLELFEHRVAMCEVLCADAPVWLKTTTVEAEVGGEGRTVDTLRHLTERLPEARFTLVIGSDILRDLPNWKDFAGIQRLAQVLVLLRAGHPASEAVGPPLAEVSSTEVRRRLISEDRVEELVPRAVLEYIRGRKLYQGSA